MLELLAQNGEDAVKDAFSWSAALQYSVLVVTLLVGLTTLGRTLNKRINSAAQEAVKAAKETQQKLSMSNGHTVGNVIEQLPHSIEELKEIARSSRNLAQQAVRLGIQNHEDLQEHKRIEHRLCQEKFNVDS